jgi:hypothetical protein
MVLLVLQEVLVLQGVLVLQAAQGNINLKVQTVQTAPLHLVVQTITMWLLGILMLHIQEHITTTITRRYILTVMGT